MKTVCELDKCTGCRACIERCNYKAISIIDSIHSINAVIDETLCVNCGGCEKVCQVHNPVKTFAPLSWYEGWANDKGTRKDSSSGGAATALMTKFVEEYGTVCSCMFSNEDFCFAVANRPEAIKQFSGSKYVKSNPQAAFRIVKERLQSGERVLFLGLPCQVAGILSFLPKKLHDNLFTIDLICHGTPSIKLLEKFLYEHGYGLKEFKDIKFRKKDYFHLYTENYIPITNGEYRDRYMFSFLKGIIFTENCYSCPYAQLKRVSDITLGDSWGSRLEEKERKKGVSLILCNTTKGQALLRKTDIYLKTVDIDDAVRANKQLSSPSEKPKERELFFNKIKAGKNYDRAVFDSYPLLFIKQDIKKILLLVYKHLRLFGME